MPHIRLHHIKSDWIKLFGENEEEEREDTNTSNIINKNNKFKSFHTAVVLFPFGVNNLETIITML